MIDGTLRATTILNVILEQMRTRTIGRAANLYGGEVVAESNGRVAIELLLLIYGTIIAV